MLVLVKLFSPRLCRRHVCLLVSFVVLATAGLSLSRAAMSRTVLSGWCTTQRIKEERVGLLVVLAVAFLEPGQQMGRAVGGVGYGAPFIQISKPSA